LWNRACRGESNLAAEAQTGWGVRTMRTAAIAMTVAAFLVSGCEPGSGQPPKPPKPVNATIEVNTVWPSYMAGDMASGDTVVIARCRGADHYAKTPRRKNWENHWYVVTYDVLAVERGTWTDKELKFVIMDFWPTPESEIRLRMLRRMPSPFGPGLVSAFLLKTVGEPARIVAMERRSLITPYGRLTAAILTTTPEGNAEYSRILKAVEAFEEKENIPTQGVKAVDEDRPEAYVVLHRTGWGTDTKFWVYVVEKKTYAVSRVP